MPIIQVDHLTKEYRLGAMKGLKQTLLNSAARLTGKKIEAPPLFKALDDVSFSIEPGEVVGIIGHNGAGKSTLLKMLAKISTPTRGSVKVDGRIAPLIEVGAGFIPDFTGRENVYLNGSILGLSRQEIDSKFDAIVEFAEMAEFIDTPVKRYSSGMQVKLAFSVATSIEAEILIIDEVLAVGDLAFQRKCFERMEDLISHQQKTVLFVSHHVRIIERLCNRVLLLDKGKVAMDGNPTTVANEFITQMNNKALKNSAAREKATSTQSEEIGMESVSLVDSDGLSIVSVAHKHPINILLKIHVKKPVERIAFMIGIHTSDFIYLTANATVDQPRDLAPGHYSLLLTLPDAPILPGVYGVRVWIGTPENKTYFYDENLSPFTVHSDDFLITRQQDMGFFYFKPIWNLTHLDQSQGA
jgi:ABC-type polysaccharide/polyol phosphate transport system ATPase subunit